MSKMLAKPVVNQPDPLLRNESYITFLRRSKQQATAETAKTDNFIVVWKQ